MSGIIARVCRGVAFVAEPIWCLADYVLPSENLRIDDSAVFWPLSDDPLFRLVGTFSFPSSDHRLVWVDVSVPGAEH